jgi:hypothetical protein
MEKKKRRKKILINSFVEFTKLTKDKLTAAENKIIINKKKISEILIEAFDDEKLGKKVKSGIQAACKTKKEDRDPNVSPISWKFAVLWVMWHAHKGAPFFHEADMENFFCDNKTSRTVVNRYWKSINKEIFTKILKCDPEVIKRESKTKEWHLDDNFILKVKTKTLGIRPVEAPDNESSCEDASSSVFGDVYLEIRRRDAYNHQEEEKSIQLAELNCRGYRQAMIDGLPEYSEKAKEILSAVVDNYEKALSYVPNSQNVLSSILHLLKEDMRQKDSNLIDAVINMLVKNIESDILVVFLKQLVHPNSHDSKDLIIKFVEKAHWILRFIPDILSEVPPDPYDFYIFSEIRMIFYRVYGMNKFARAGADKLKLGQLREKYQRLSQSFRLKQPKHYKKIIGELEPYYNLPKAFGAGQTYQYIDVAILILLCGSYYALRKLENAQKVIEMFYEEEKFKNMGNTEESNFKKALKARFKELSAPFVPKKKKEKQFKPCGRFGNGSLKN